MRAYVFSAALLCESCGEAVKAKLPAPAEPDNESTWDSDAYPKGPYSDGGGEADSPQHCDHCHVFLDNPLTGDGLEYVRDALARNTGNPEVLAIWRARYGEQL